MTAERFIPKPFSDASDARLYKTGDLARYLPDVERPLAQLSVIVEGKDILLRQGDGLIEPGGQLRFDFGAAEGAAIDPGAAEEPAAPMSIPAQIPVS